MSRIGHTDIHTYFSFDASKSCCNKIRSDYIRDKSNGFVDIAIPSHVPTHSLKCHVPRVRQYKMSPERIALKQMGIFALCTNVYCISLLKLPAAGRPGETTTTGRHNLFGLRLYLITDRTEGVEWRADLTVNSNDLQLSRVVSLFFPYYSSYNIFLVEDYASFTPSTRLSVLFGPNIARPCLPINIWPIRKEYSNSFDLRDCRHQSSARPTLSIHRNGIQQKWSWL